jgi:hypothetical protein
LITLWLVVAVELDMTLVVVAVQEVLELELRFL